MDDLTNTIDTQNTEPQIEEELSHSDKMIGIFTEPAATFEKTAKFPPRTIDWLLPVSLLIIIFIVANILLMNNPTIKYDITQKQVEQMRKNFDDAVAKGQMSQEQADEQVERMQETMESMGAGMMIMQHIGTVIFLFIAFFLVTLVYFIFAKFILKGDGTFASAMVANGLPYYIGIIGVIVMTILSLAFNKFFAGTSVAAFMGTEKGSFTNFLLGRLDLFTVWSLIITGIGLGKMFKSTATGKYIGVVLGIWIVWGLITLGIAKAVPFLSFLAQ